MPLIREKIENNGKVSFTPKGISMNPLLRSNRDTVIIKSVSGRLKKYDIALYIRDNKKYVLHRVVKVNKKSYTMRGDNQLFNEYGITDEQIIGVVAEFIRKGKRINVNKPGYKLYCVLWVNSCAIRRIFRMGRRLLGKIKRKIVRK